MLTVKSDYHKMESYAKKKPFIFGIIAFSILIVTLAIITIILQMMLAKIIIQMIVYMQR